MNEFLLLTAEFTPVLFLLDHHTIHHPRHIAQPPPPPPPQALRTRELFNCNENCWRFIYFPSYENVCFILRSYRVTDQGGDRLLLLSNFCLSLIPYPLIVFFFFFFLQGVRYSRNTPRDWGTARVNARLGDLHQPHYVTLGVTIALIKGSGYSLVDGEYYAGVFGKRGNAQASHRYPHGRGCVCVFTGRRKPPRHPRDDGQTPELSPRSNNHDSRVRERERERMCPGGEEEKSSLKEATTETPVKLNARSSILSVFSSLFSPVSREKIMICVSVARKVFHPLSAPWFSWPRSTPSHKSPHRS